MRSLVLGIGVVFAGGLVAQVSPYTGKPLQPPDSSGNYRLLFGGHFHGASSNRSGYPAATLLAGIDTINSLGANALISTGDLFLDPDRDSARYVNALFSKLDMALFNAPGNHDLEGDAYRGSASMPMELKMGRDRILLLDTERDGSDLLNDQLELLVQAAEDAEGGRLGVLFIVSHRPVWAEEEEQYGDLFKGNTRSATHPNFEKEVFPLLERIGRSSKVYWISGSMAGLAPASIFFQQHRPNITYIQCAIRDELRDALLIADVAGNTVRWTAFSLTGQPLETVATYDAAWWRAHQKAPEGFKWRLLPYLVKKNLGYPSYWIGFATALISALLALVLFRRKGSQR